MAIYSDLELERILNEAEEKNGSYADKIRSNADDIKDVISKESDSVKSNFKKNSWIGKKISKSKDNKGTQKLVTKKKVNSNGEVEEISYIEDFDDECVENDDVYTESLINKFKKSKKNVDIDDTVTDLTNKSAVEIEKQKQEWRENPGQKTGETIGDIVTGGNFVNKAGKKVGSAAGSKIDDILEKRKKKSAQKEEFDFRNVYRTKEYTKAMNEFFDITDDETRHILLAVNEADQNKVLVSLTSKLYESVIDKVDDIDFGEIPATKGDITKLSNYQTMVQCISNMEAILIEFKQDTSPIQTIKDAISNIIDSKDIWQKAYAINVELPMVTYNTIVLAIIESVSYLVSMCVEFIKSPSQDTMQVMINKSGLTKSKQHMLFKNLEDFNDAYRKGQVEKAMKHVIDENSARKNFVGATGLGVGAAIVGVAGLLFCIIPIIRELIFLFYYNRVRVSEFFDLQADMLQVNSYNVENSRMDLTKEERKKISTKQMKVAERFRKVANVFSIECKKAENSAVNDIKKESSKKYKANDVMDELPDSAASALF